MYCMYEESPLPGAAEVMRKHFMTKEEREEHNRIKENEEVLLRFKRRWRSKKALIISLQVISLAGLAYILYTII